MVLTEDDIPKLTLRDIAKRIDRDRHTAWYHLKKYGFAKMIGGRILLSENDYKSFIGRINLVNRK